MSLELKDHLQSALSHVLEQFKDKEVINALLEVMIAEVQEVEEAAYAILTGRSIATGIGKQLDDIGEDLGVPRFALNDVDYAERLELQIYINTSDGTGKDVGNILKRATKADNVYLARRYPAFVHLHTDGVVTPEVLKMIPKVVAAGVQTQLTVNESGAPFVFADDPTGEGFNDLGEGGGLSSQL